MEEELLNRIKELEARLDRAENPVKAITMYPRARAIDEPSHDENERFLRDYLKSFNS